MKGLLFGLLAIPAAATAFTATLCGINARNRRTVHRSHHISSDYQGIEQVLAGRMAGLSPDHRIVLDYLWYRCNRGDMPTYMPALVVALDLGLDDVVAETVMDDLFGDIAGIDTVNGYRMDMVNHALNGKYYFEFQSFTLMHSRIVRYLMLVAREDPRPDYISKDDIADDLKITPSQVSDAMDNLFSRFNGGKQLLTERGYVMKSLWDMLENGYGVLYPKNVRYGGDKNLKGELHDTGLISPIDTSRRHS